MVSAVVGQTSLLRKFAVAWKRALHCFDVNFFHAKDHWNLHASPYHNLSMTEGRKLLSRLSGHMGKYVEAAISVAINPDEYRSMTSDRFRSHWGSPYTMAIQLLLIVIHNDLQRQKRGHEIANILLEGGPHVHQALEVIEKTKGSNFAFIRIAASGCGPKLNNPLLQAADILAYGWGEYLVSERSEMLDAIASKRPDRFPIFGLTPGLIERFEDGHRR